MEVKDDPRHVIDVVKTWADVEAIAPHVPLMDQMVAAVRQGLLTREQALATMVVGLSDRVRLLEAAQTNRSTQRALHCPILHLIVTLDRDGAASREQLLIAAAIALSEAWQSARDQIATAATQLHDLAELARRSRGTL